MWYEAGQKGCTMKKSKITLSKIVKLPIEGIQFSNQQFGVEIEYEGEGFDIDEAKGEMDKVLEVIKDPDPKWLRQEPKQYRLDHKWGTNEAKKGEK